MAVIRGRWRPTLRDVRDAAVGLLTTASALLVAAAVLTDLELGVGTALLVAAAVSVADVLVRPFLRLLLSRSGPVGALALGLVAQVLVVQVALTVVPGVRTTSVSTAVWTLVLVAVSAAAARWLLGAGDKDYLVADLLRRARRGAGHRVPQADGAAPGVVVVQLDGLPFPVLMHGIMSGNLPTLARWVGSGTHTADMWWARVPCTTPASQAGLLHGTNEDIPAFRWFEKETGRLLVANRPGDAAVIEARLSDGAGLLAHGGVSISNLFSGDAATNLMVMSRAGHRRGLGAGSAYLRFFASPFVFLRALLLTVGEMVKELHQARRQRVRGIVPRVARRGSYVVLRGLTNALLRDLDVVLVADAMVRGAPVVFVDFVDYDEIAHHAGVVRPESLDALSGLDGVLATLERVAAATDRPYRFVVLSDHGQSQGTTFRQLTGRSLEQHVRTLVGARAGEGAVSAEAEAWGPVDVFLTEVLGSDNAASRWGRRRADGVTGSAGDDDAAPVATTAEPVVVASGNLGLVWFPALEGKVQGEEIQQLFPALVPGLLREPGIGFVVVHSERGPVAIGPRGVHLLTDGTVEGEDPLEPFGRYAAADLARVCGMREAGDLLVHSAVDPVTGAVHAFEEQVGSHGGLGGWQNQAVLVHPSDWAVDADLRASDGPDEPVLYGADVVHRQLVRWLERAGTRPPADGLARHRTEHVGSDEHS